MGSSNLYTNYLQWRSTQVRQCTQVRLESIFLRTRTWTLRTMTRVLRTQTQRTIDLWCCHIYYILHWDSMFKKIQWTFSIYFSQVQLFSVPTVSVSVFTAGYRGYSKQLCQGYTSQTDTEVTGCTCNSSMQVEQVFSSGEILCGHTGQHSRTSWVMI